MTEDTKKQILCLHRQGLLDREIAEKLHYSRTYVSKVLKANGIVRQRGKRANDRIVQKVLRMHRCGFTDSEIAERMSLSKPYIRQLLQRSGIHRKRGRKRKVNAAQTEQIMELRAQGMSYRKIGLLTRINQWTVVGVVKREKQKNESRRNGANR